MEPDFSVMTVRMKVSVIIINIKSNKEKEKESDTFLEIIYLVLTKLTTNNNQQLSFNIQRQFKVLQYFLGERISHTRNFFE